MEKFRNAFLRELVERGLDPEVVGQALAAFDAVAPGFECTETETGLIVAGVIPEAVKTYLAVKHIEGCSDQTLYNYKKCLEMFFDAVRMRPEEVKPNTIRAYLHKYQEDRGVSLRTLDKIRSMLSSFFGWAADEGYLERNPMRTVKAIRSEKKQRRSLSRDELAKMKRACMTAQERAVLDVLYSTGCRASELISIKISDIDFTSRRVEVFGKGKKYRNVDLNAEAILSIYAYMAERDDDDPHLIVSERAPHNGITRESLGKIVKKIADRAGVKGVSPHILRHTMATLAMQGGMAVQNLQRSLGHEQISTTMIYAETDDTEVKNQHMKYVV